MMIITMMMIIMMITIVLLLWLLLLLLLLLLFLSSPSARLLPGEPQGEPLVQHTLTQVFSSKVASTIANYGDPWHDEACRKQAKPHQTSSIRQVVPAKEQRGRHDPRQHPLRAHIYYYLKLYYIMLCNVMLYYAILHYLILYYILFSWGAACRWRPPACSCTCSSPTCWRHYLSIYLSLSISLSLSIYV